MTVSAGVVNGLGAMAPSDETLIITDDEEPPTVKLVLTPASISESDDTGTAAISEHVSTVTAILSHPSSAATTVTVSPALAGDYTLSMNKTLSIAEGATASTGAVTITAVNNEVDAPDKEVTVSAEADNEVGVTDPEMETLTITDDDDMSTTLTLTVAPAEVDEDAAAAVTLTVTGTLNAGTRTEETVVTLAVEDETATVTDDYTAAAATLTIAAEQASATAALSLTPEDDAVSEGPETVRIGGTVTVSGLTVAPATVTIIDDETPPAVTLFLAPAAIGENGGVSRVVARQSNVSSGVTIMTVSVEADPDPRLAADFTLVGSTLGILPGALTSTGSVTITAVDNDVDEGDKTVTVSAEAVNTSGVTEPVDQILDIIDDDTRGVTVSEMALTLEDGGSGTYTVVLDSEPTGSVIVAPARKSGGSTDIEVSGSLTFTPGNWDTPQTVTVTATADTDALDDTAVIEHMVTGADSDYGSVMAAEVLVTVDDQDASDATLSALTLSGIHIGTFVGGDTNLTAYSAVADVNSTTVTATPSSGSSSVLIKREDSTDTTVGTTKTLFLAFEGVNVITVTVTAADSSMKTYTVSVTRVAQPFARWKMDNNANDAIGTLHGTLKGDASFATESKHGSHSLELDGSGDWVDLKDHRKSFPQGGQARSLTGWFKADTATYQQQSFFQHGDKTGSNKGSDFSISADRTEVSVDVDDHKWGVDGLGLSGAWHHVAIVFEANGASNQFTIYVDGERRDAETLSGSPQEVDTKWGTQAAIGKKRHNSDYYDGQIDDVRLYDRPLTVTQVAELYHLGAGSGALPEVPEEDGLIRVSNLEQLNAIRFDKDGDGEADSADQQTKYTNAFPNAHVCPVSGCLGYKLTADLDFSGHSYVSREDGGWDPIGNEFFPVRFIFDGKGHTISNLYIDQNSTATSLFGFSTGLFGYSTGTIRNVGLEKVYVRGGEWVGGLVGRNEGEVSTSYVTGQVSSASTSSGRDGGEAPAAGGLVGLNEGKIRMSYARASVGMDISMRAGGLVGENRSAGSVAGCYAHGTANATTGSGGLFAWNKGGVKVSYTTSRVHRNNNRSGGFAGGVSNPVLGSSSFDTNYWMRTSGLVQVDIDFNGKHYDVPGKWPSELEAPTNRRPGIYGAWDDHDVTGDGVRDAPWDFGTDEQYPALKVDFNGDGIATVEEFGQQWRADEIEADWRSDTQTHAASRAVSKTWIDFLLAKEDGRQSVLPDFSYSGYKYSSQEPPYVTHDQFNVTDYGAVADDNRSDQVAIQATIDAAEAHGSGIVFFPSGQFLVNTDTDPVASPISATNSSITIEGDNIVLRGSGSRDGGTIIRQVNNLTVIDPGDKWTVPWMFHAQAPNWPEQVQMGAGSSTKDIGFGEVLTTITGDSPRGSFWIKVADTSDLSVGQRIGLFLEDTAAKGAHLAPYDAHSRWTSLQEKGVAVPERHSIADIQGDNFVRLHEPIHTLMINSNHDWEVRESVPVIREIGFEDISFQGSFFDNFEHHSRAKDNSGWSLIKMRGCVDCWIRRVSFVNVNRGWEINASAAVSIYQTTLKGNMGHFIGRNINNYGLWVGLSEDLIGQQHGYNLMEATHGSVYWRSTLRRNQPVDFHAYFPYANLHDRVRGGDLDGSGGNVTQLPNHGRHLVIWNYDHDSIDNYYDFWPGSGDTTSIVMPIVVGFYGEDVKFKKFTMEISESVTTEVSPGSLFEAQLEARLGSLPSWLSDLLPEWETLRTTTLTVPTVLTKGYIDDMVLSLGASRRIDAGDNVKTRHDASVSGHSAGALDWWVATAIVDRKSDPGQGVTINAVGLGTTGIYVYVASTKGDTARLRFNVTVVPLLAHWPMNSNVNDIVSGFSGTRRGGAGFSTDRKLGSRSLTLDGSGDWVELTAHRDKFPRGDSARSFAAWFKTSVSSYQKQSFFHYGYNSNHSTGEEISISADRTEVSVDVDEHKWGVDNLGLGSGWHHMAVTYEEGGRSDTFKIYVDSVLQSSGTLTGSPRTVDTRTQSDSKAAIGRKRGDESDYYNGKIDDVRLYSYALTQAEITSLYNTTNSLSPLRTAAKLTKPTALLPAIPPRSSPDTGALSSDASLGALRLSGVNFGAFSSAVTDYAAAVAHDAPATEVVAAPADAGASVVIEDANGGTAGRRRTVALAEGENTISITVTAEDGRTTRTYRARVTRGPDEWVRDAQSFALDRNNTAPAGLWSDRDTLWVADWEERKLFAYGLPEGERLLERDIAVEGAPMGLWSDGETIWVVNHYGGLQAYRLADGGRVLGRDLELADSTAPVGLWSDGATVWVSEWLGRTVKAYLLADGSRVPSRDMVVDDAVETLIAAGIWADGLTLWLADWSVDQVRALGMSDGLLKAGRSVATAAAGYADPTGLWSDGATLWVTAWNGERVHVHALPRAPAAGAGPMLRPAASAFARGAGRLTGENRELNLGTTAAGLIAGTALRVNGGEPRASGQAGVSIADAILRGRILAALGKAAEQPLSVADMAALRVLNLRHAGVVNLSGLEHAVHLEELGLGFNPVADLSSLAALPALASLDLDGVSLANLAPLSTLTGLSRLSLRNNAVVELAPLAELTRLTRLDLGGNQIANLYPLSGLTELTELWADGNRISDISALAPLTRLTQLDLSDNRIRYLHALSGMRQLDTLKLAGNGLSQLYPLSGLTGLQTLVLRGNTIEELQPLSHLGELQSLDVHGNRITELHPLFGLRSLVWLDICHNRIEDFSPAHGLSTRIILGMDEQHQGISD